MASLADAQKRSYFKSDTTSAHLLYHLWSAGRGEAVFWLPPSFLIIIHCRRTAGPGPQSARGLFKTIFAFGGFHNLCVAHRFADSIAAVPAPPAGAPPRTAPVLGSIAREPQGGRSGEVRRRRWRARPARGAEPCESGWRWRAGQTRRGPCALPFALFGMCVGAQTTAGCSFLLLKMGKMCQSPRQGAPAAPTAPQCTQFPKPAGDARAIRPITCLPRARKLEHVVRTGAVGGLSKCIKSTVVGGLGKCIIPLRWEA